MKFLSRKKKGSSNLILFDGRETLPEELNLDLCFVTKYLSNNLDNDELTASIYPRPGLRPVEAILVSTRKDQILTKHGGIFIL